MKRLFAQFICILSVGGIMHAAELPNILWITSEDNGPHLGCYGDTYAVTPNLDGLAAKGVIYLNAWSNAPVCAPARTTIITGVYPTATGSQHMRSDMRLPSYMKMFPQYLRELGYYCTNNSKEDYNVEKPGTVWDESSRTAHWKNRRPGQPFFAVFNYTISHESQIRNEIADKDRIHDPSKVRVPAYHPDTPEVRKDWAQYYDRLTMMDARVGNCLKELEAAGLMDETIIFYYGDHGSGMPRSKRWPYNSGLNVPLIVYVPEKWRHLAPTDYSVGGKSDQLVGFIDLAPTVLSLADIQPPAWMQGHAFMGNYRDDPQPYLFGFRGRMDERYDMVRSVRDQSFIYIRNYHPHRIYGQYVDYMFQTPTTRVWKELYDAGKLRPPQTCFWETKPPEELYDLRNDPDEVANLAGSPDQRETLERFRAALRDHAAKIRDVGFLPESEIHSRSADSTPYDMGHDDFRYPFQEIKNVAERVSSLKEITPEMFATWMKHEDSAVRYWAAMGILMRGESAVEKNHAAAREALADESSAVRIVAAEALGRFGDESDLKRALPVLLDCASLERYDLYTCMNALNAIDYLDEKASGIQSEIQALPESAPGISGRLRANVPKLKEKILRDLQ